MTAHNASGQELHVGLSEPILKSGDHLQEGLPHIHDSSVSSPRRTMQIHPVSRCSSKGREWLQTLVGSAVGETSSLVQGCCWRQDKRRHIGSDVRKRTFFMLGQAIPV